jgi:hypothetical protein
MNRWNVRVATLFAIALLGSLACNYKPRITAVLVLAATALAAAESIRTRRIPREALFLTFPFGYWALSFLVTGESWSVFFSLEFQRHDGALYASLLPMAAVAALPLDRERMRGAILLYLVVQAAVAAAGAVSVLGGWTSMIYKTAHVVDQDLTFFGFYVTHNATASVYCLLAVGALSWALRKDLEPRIRGLLMGVAILLTLGTVLARSRGVFVALLVGAGFVVFRALRRGVSGRFLAPAILGLIVAILAGGALLIPRFARMGEIGADDYRKKAWTRAWEDFKRSPAVGVGFGRFNDANRVFESVGIGQVVGKAKVVNNDYHAHNSYLHWLAEGGIVGLAVMAAFWFLVARELDRRDDLMREWILAGIVSMAVMSLTEHYAGGTIFLIHLAFLIGVHASGREEAPA